VAVRLSDVAARSGVSEATVSRVLNNKPGVSETNRRAVLTTLEVLGYERPARMRTKKAGLVGLIVPELDNPVFPMFAQGIETALARQGYTPVLCTQTSEGVHEDEYVRMLLDRNVAGIVFVSGIHANLDTDPGRYVALRERGVPIVLINGYLPGVDAPFLSNDDATGIDLSVRHLAELGHRRIGLAIGPDRYVPVQRKIAAFRVAIQTYVDSAATADAVESLIDRTVFSIAGGADATARLVARGVTAVICGSDVMALGAIRASRRLGLTLPRDLSIVGCDDIVLSEFTDPPLTTIRQPVAEIADAAARALLAEITGDPAPRAEYVFRPELLIRASTAPPTPAAKAPAPRSSRR
jgi:LacI family transcriptional regulator, repressor for deo operon, udp, cdd, tsx, nupC, and nupG